MGLLSVHSGCILICIKGEKEMNLIKLSAGVVMSLTAVLALKAENFPLQKLFDRMMAAPAPANWQPTGVDRNIYLDMMEPIIRNAAHWVDERGAVIDPVIKREWNQTSCRFASPGAILLRYGRIPELKETIFKVMDYCCKKLPELRKKESPDFWMRELVTAIRALEGIAPEEKLTEWRNFLAKVEPEVVYYRVKPDHTDLHTLNNWVVYSACGEAMRQGYGIGGGDWIWGREFFDIYMTAQLKNFNSNGLYRDPNDPFTYDFTTRLQFIAALNFGYDGKLDAVLKDILDKGAKTMLLYMMPSGSAPFGGRSALFNFQEGIISAICEYYAAIYKKIDPELAGAFKRQARLSAIEVKKHFTDAGEPFHIKNRFPISSRFGCDSYGHYSVYSLYAASVLGVAALLADESVAEMPCPSEKGGYSFALTDSFFKVFGNAHGHALEFNFSGDIRNDSVGLGRIMLKNAPYAVLPVMPFTATPSYVTTGNKENCSISAVWQDEQNNRVNGADGVDRWEYIPGKNGDLKVIQHYRGCRLEWDCSMETSGITIEFTLDGKYHDAKLNLPLLKTNGKDKFTATVDGNNLKIATVKIENLSGSGFAAAQKELPNRSGIYRIYQIPLKSGKAKLRFTVQ